MLPGEDQAPESCEDCGTKLELQVLRSAAGHYIGTACQCGPYSRASDYFPSREAAEAELAMWREHDVRPSGRTPGYFGEEAPCP